jgi:hypothetical protein
VLVLVFVFAVDVVVTVGVICVFLGLVHPSLCICML